MKTYFATNETARRDWVIVDAAGQTLGRLATEIARRLAEENGHAGSDNRLALFL